MNVLKFVQLCQMYQFITVYGPTYCSNAYYMNMCQMCNLQSDKCIDA